MITRAMLCIIAGIALGFVPVSFAAQEEAAKADGGISCSCEIKNVDLKGAEEHQQAMMEKFDKDKDGKLSAAERDEAQWAVLQEMVENCQAMRDRFDKDSDGKLSGAEEAEFNKALESRQEHAAAKLAQFDADKDGILSAEERKHAIETSMAQSLENWLQKFDKNSDGTLDVNESHALIADLVASVEQRREKLWKQFDTDKDGKLSDSERNTAKDAIKAAFEKRHQQIVALFDKDKDGKLSQEERAKIEPAAIFCSCELREKTAGEKTAEATKEEAGQKAIDTSADKKMPTDADAY